MAEDTVIVGRSILVAIRLYKKVISPLFPNTCRFYPSCSTYMYQAVEQEGALRGVCLGFKRLLRCHPWNAGGVDPVPRGRDREG